MTRSTWFLTRVWRDGALRSLPLWVVVTALNTSVLLGVIAFRGALGRQGIASAAQLTLVLWLAIAVYLIFGKVRTRCHRLDLVLPIPARRLWFAHSAAAVLATGVVLSASLGVVALHRWLLSNLRENSILEIELLPIVGPLIAGLLLALALVQLGQSRLWRQSGGRAYWARLLSGLAGVPILLVLLSARPLLSTAVCLVAALAVGLVGYRAVPPGYLLVPPEAAPRPAGARSTPAVVSQPGATGRWTRYRLLFRILHHVPPWKRFLPTPLYSFIALTGFVLAGGLNFWLLVDEIRFFYLPLGIYMLFAGIGLLTYHLYRLDPLPVPRRAIFAVLVLPSLAAFLVGYTSGRIALRSYQELPPSVDYRVDEPYYWVEIDPGYMGFAWDGQAPILRAPWGEAHPAWTRPLFKGSSAALYHPFNTAEESTAEFEALMTSRAIEAIYGEVISPSEILERYFVVEDNHVVGLKEGGFSLLEDYPQLKAPPAGPSTPVYLVLTLASWLLLVALLVSTFRATASHRRIRAVYWAALLFLLAIIVSQVALAVLRWYSPDAAHVLMAIFVRWLAGSPTYVLAAWTISTLLILTSYRLAERQFRRAEIPASPIQCSLVDWGAQETVG